MLDPETKCRLFPGLFGIVLQGLLGVLCFGSLVAKWRVETPRRRFRVFVRDSSKQVLASFLAHWFNILIALIFSARPPRAAEYPSDGPQLAVSSDEAEHRFGGDFVDRLGPALGDDGSGTARLAQLTSAHDVGGATSTDFASWSLSRAIVSELEGSLGVRRRADPRGDACDWYYINVTCDCTLGMCINFCLLRLSERVFGYKSGAYVAASAATGSRRAASVNDSPRVEFLDAAERASAPLVVATSQVRDDSANASAPNDPQSQSGRGSSDATRGESPAAASSFKKQMWIWCGIVVTMKCIMFGIFVVFHRDLLLAAHFVLEPIARFFAKRTQYVMQVLMLLSSVS